MKRSWRYGNQNAWHDWEQYQVKYSRLENICDFLPEEWVSLPGYCKVYENIHWLESYKIQVVIKIISCLWLSHFPGCDGLMVRSHSMTETLPKWPMQINWLRPEQNGHHSADDIFKSIFLKKRRNRLYWKFKKINFHQGNHTNIICNFANIFLVCVCCVCVCVGGGGGGGGINSQETPIWKWMSQLILSKSLIYSSIYSAIIVSDNSFLHLLKSLSEPRLAYC